MKNLFLVALVVFIVGSGYFYMKQSPTPAPVGTNTSTEVTQAMTEGATQTFNIKGLNFAFDVKEIRVKKGDKVTINFTNTEGFHDFKIDELNVTSKQIQAGESETVTFTADKAGTFEYYCSVGQHRQNGMWGKLIVE
ncbi:cupredoxin domain-containing protein [Candidatus Shapirobacteria bacterium]|nr:cupredoxin domain-containing protein [Candidatus Shapirobacteria bacterium]